MADKIKDQDIEISRLKARVKSLEDKERRREEPIQKDAPITRGIIDIEEKLGADKSTEKGSNDTKEMVNVLSSMEAANILSSGGTAFSTASVSLADVFPVVGVPTISGSFPTISVILPLPMWQHHIKEGQKEQIDDQVAREMEEEFARENQRLSEQTTRDSEIARIHVEEELKLMIKGLDRSNKVVAKYLSEYEQAEADLSVGEKIELISELVKYQDHLAEILKYQAQQSKPSSMKEQRRFYMSVLKSHTGWKTEHFRGITLEQIKEKFILVWKHMQDFVPMSSKEESEKVKRPGIKLDQGSSKRVKISHTSRSEPSQEQQFKVSKGVSEEGLKGMMQLVPLEEVYIEALQQFNRDDLHQLWILVKETFSIKQCTRDKEKELWVELKRLFEADSKDQLWIYHQAFMHVLLDSNLYDTCGVYHESLLGLVLYKTPWPIKGVLSNGIYEIDMHDLVSNINSIYNVSTKRAKHNLDFTYLWHCRLAHISKKRIEKLQHEGFLKSTDDESFDQCVSCLSGKITRKSFPHRLERATDLLGIIHIDVRGPLRHVPRQGASYFITFTDDYSRYGYIYLLKHKHEDYALESTKCILNMVLTKKVDKTPYELWSVKCIFIGYPKETMGYNFYFPLENKIVVARYAEFFEKNLISQEVSGRAIDLKEIQDEDTLPSKITSKIPMEVEGFEPPQEEVILIHSESNKWIDAMNAEIQSMIDKMVWVLVDLPPVCKTVGNKWIFKKKTNMDGIVSTYKARLVSKGYTQLYGVDYEEMFSPIADIRAVRILISIMTFYDYEIWQMDVKTAFLNGYLDKDNYMVQPEGFVNPKHPKKVCKLQRSIYGLKQASRS
uniref:Retrotransposon protein, putative, Ty1-copia subclass n=1 Tax=Tanacetum cinerariifolium TaxID=118510 RepID=A0A699HJI8_TANCI|nr:hypothetical protein [Tanacetum cinerariifolium]GEY39019.1 hypothetical protein [Tanacetum cinerariifolium]